jgi:pentapeptide MXKDX repeat protein
MTARLILSLCAGAVCLGLAAAPVVLAQGMTKEGTAMSNPSGDKMAAPDAMGKTDAMGNTDSMAKPADKADAMKKAEDEKKKDGMSSGMSGGMAK